MPETMTYWYFWLFCFVIAVGIIGYEGIQSLFPLLALQLFFLVYWKIPSMVELYTILLTLLTHERSHCGCIFLLIKHMKMDSFVIPIMISLLSFLTIFTISRVTHEYTSDWFFSRKRRRN